MTKPEQFLWIAQTAILADVLSRASHPHHSLETHAAASSSTALSLSNQAVYASEHIPSDMSAFEAVHEFCLFTLWSPDEKLNDAERNRIAVPRWFTPELLPIL